MQAEHTEAIEATVSLDENHGKPDGDLWVKPNWVTENIFYQKACPFVEHMLTTDWTKKRDKNHAKVERNIILLHRHIPVEQDQAFLIAKADCLRTNSLIKEMS